MQCFVVQSDEIEGRLDPNLYEPKYKKLSTNLKNIKCQELGNIVAFSNETWDQKTFFGDKFPYIEISEIDVISGEIRNIIYYDKKEAPSRARMVLREDDIIVSTTRPHRGAISLIDKSKDGFIASTGFAVLRELKTNEIGRDFLFYTLKADFCLNQMLQRSSGGNYPAITTEELKKIIIPLSPLSTQTQIIEIMRSAFEHKKQKEAEALRLLDSIDGYVLNELGIKLPEDEDKMCFVVSSEEVQNNRVNVYYYQPKFKEVGKALEKGKYRIAKLKEFVTKIHYGVSIKNVYVDEGIPLLRILNIEPNKIDLTEIAHLEESKRQEIGSGFVYEGDLLVSRSGSVGIVAVVPKEADGFAFGSFMIKFCVTDEVNKEYVSIWLNNKISKLFTEREKIGAIQGNITISTIENFLVPLPPLEIQNKIADEVKRRISETERLKAEAREIIEKSKKQVEGMILGDN
mgnify:CR=1 FL=1